MYGLQKVFCFPMLEPELHIGYLSFGDSPFSAPFLVPGLYALSLLAVNRPPDMTSCDDLEFITVILISTQFATFPCVS